MRTRTSLVAAGVALAVSGCGGQGSSTPRTGGTRAEWTKTHDSAESLDSARAACEQSAVDETADVRQLGAKAAAGAFVKCMRERGWEMQSP